MLEASAQSLNAHYPTNGVRFMIGSIECLETYLAVAYDRTDAGEPNSARFAGRSLNQLLSRYRFEMPALPVGLISAP